MDHGSCSVDCWEHREQIPGQCENEGGVSFLWTWIWLLSGIFIVHLHSWTYAMRNIDIAVPFICQSVTLQYHVKTAKHIISKFFHRQIVHRCSFLTTNRCYEIRTELPVTMATGGYEISWFLASKSLTVCRIQRSQWLTIPKLYVFYQNTWSSITLDNISSSFRLFLRRLPKSTNILNNGT